MGDYEQSDSEKLFTWHISLTQSPVRSCYIETCIQLYTQVNAKFKKPWLSHLNLQVHWPSMPIDVTFFDGINEGCFLCVSRTLKEKHFTKTTLSCHATHEKN